MMVVGMVVMKVVVKVECWVDSLVVGTVACSVVG